MRAWYSEMISSISSGRPENTSRATTAHTANTARAMPASARRLPVRHRAAMPAQSPGRHQPGRRRSVIAAMMPTPSTMPPPLSHPARRSPYHGASWPPGIQLAIGSRPNTSRTSAATWVIDSASSRSIESTGMRSKRSGAPTSGACVSSQIGRCDSNG